MRASPCTWTEAEVATLVAHYEHTFLNELLELLPGKNYKQLIGKANVLGLVRGARRVLRPATYDDPEAGGYVSGLVDGEGSFAVSIVNRRGRWNFNPKLQVGMRLDDAEILPWLLDYFGCGRYNEALARTPPIGIFCVADLYSIVSRVLPHFDKFGLRAKKRHDYVIWREMVMLQAEYFRLTWPDRVRRRMQQLYDELKQTRKFKQ
jgi:hypothetical protein